MTPYSLLQTALVLLVWERPLDMHSSSHNSPQQFRGHVHSGPHIHAGSCQKLGA